MSRSSGHLSRFDYPANLQTSSSKFCYCSWSPRSGITRLTLYAFQFSGRSRYIIYCWNKKSQYFSMLIPTSAILKSYGDQTGKFHTISSRGNHYTFMLYNYDTNSIHATALPNCQTASILNAWESTNGNIWRTLLANELGCCSQGVSKNWLAKNAIDGTQRIFSSSPTKFLPGAKSPTLILFAPCVPTSWKSTVFGWQLVAIIWTHIKRSNLLLLVSPIPNSTLIAPSPMHTVVLAIVPAT